jgi:hypothetical protein
VTLGGCFERFLVTTLAVREGWGIDVRNIPRVTIVNEAGNLPPGMRSVVARMRYVPDVALVAW